MTFTDDLFVHVFIVLSLVLVVHVVKCSFIDQAATKAMQGLNRVMYNFSLTHGSILWVPYCKINGPQSNVLRQLTSKS